MHIILIVVSSEHSINVDKFRELTNHTVRLFVNNYNCYYMPPTLHRFLIHGADIICSAFLLICQLSEEA